MSAAATKRKQPEGEVDIDGLVKHATQQSLNLGEGGLDWPATLRRLKEEYGGTLPEDDPTRIMACMQYIVMDQFLRSSKSAIAEILDQYRTMAQGVAEAERGRMTASLQQMALIIRERLNVEARDVQREVLSQLAEMKKLNQQNEDVRMSVRLKYGLYGMLLIICVLLLGVGYGRLLAP